MHQGTLRTCTPFLPHPSLAQAKVCHVTLKGLRLGPLLSADFVPTLANLTSAEVEEISSVQQPSGTLIHYI